MVSESIVVVRELMRVFTDLGWRIRSRSDEDSGGFDVVVIDPSGHTYFVEVKVGQETAHFASLARVQAAAARHEKQEGHAITPVFLTTEEVSPTMSKVADEVGVKLVRAPVEGSA